MNPRQWSSSMAQQVWQQVQQGTSEMAIQQTLFDWINHIIAEQQSEFLSDLTSMAMHEQDADRKATYFRVARMVQMRIPKAATH